MRRIGSIGARIAIVATMVAPAIALTGNEHPSVELYVESGIRHSARGVAFSPDGSLVAAGSLDRTIKVWSVASGREIATLVNGSMSTSLSFLREGLILAAAGEDGRVQFWDVAYRKPAYLDFQCTDKQSPSIALNADSTELFCVDGGGSVIRRWNVQYRGQVQPAYYVDGLDSSSRLGTDGAFVVTSGIDGFVRMVEVKSSRVLGTFPGPSHNFESVAYGPRSGLLATIPDGGGSVDLWSWDGTGEPHLQQTVGGQNVHAVAISPDEAKIAVAMENGDVVIIDATMVNPFARPLLRLGSFANRVENAAVMEGSVLLAVQSWYDSQLVFDLQRGGLSEAEIPKLSAGTGGFAEVGEFNGRRFAVKRLEDRVEIRSEEGQLIGTLVVLDKIGAWVATNPQGLFDTNMDLSDVKGVHWLVDGRTMEPLPLEILMRDYFQPQLLPRLLSGASLPKPRPLSALNRVQPRIKILSVSPGPTSDTARVSIEASPADDPTQPNGKTHTDAYDLRLFRNGQLVGHWPEGPGGGDEISAWRKRTHLDISSGSTTFAHDFIVRIPTSRETKTVTFSAYAFNEERVKSATTTANYAIPADVTPRKPRAYVITIGVDAYQAPGRVLHFAMRDAQAMGGALSQLEGYEMVPVSLTSEGEDEKLWQATKGNIREVLARLAGKSATAGALAHVKGVNQLAVATPDDVVIVTFSGHGHTAAQRSFYLLPSDSGAETEISPGALAKFISSEELSQWLLPVDAGQMALIIDACHSAASVEQPGFKPGPMGDRGLGQLAYDKAMRILAASQADAVALESTRLKQGLLTYALVHDGLAVVADGKRAADADHDGRLTLAEWLRWGELHTPELYEDIQSGRKDAVYADRDGIIDPRLKSRVITRAQTPALFDFARVRQVAPVIK